MNNVVSTSICQYNFQKRSLCLIGSKKFGLVINNVWLILSFPLNPRYKLNCKNILREIEDCGLLQGRPNCCSRTNSRLLALFWSQKFKKSHVKLNISLRKSKPNKKRMKWKQNLLVQKMTFWKKNCWYFFKNWPTTFDPITFEPLHRFWLYLKFKKCNIQKHTIQRNSVEWFKWFGNVNLW